MAAKKKSTRKPKKVIEPRKTKPKKDPVEFVMMPVRIPKSLKKSLAVISFNEEISQTQIVLRAIRAHLRDLKQKQPDLFRSIEDGNTQTHRKGYAKIRKADDESASETSSDSTSSE